MDKYLLCILEYRYNVSVYVMLCNIIWTCTSHIRIAYVLRVYVNHFSINTTLHCASKWELDWSNSLFLIAGNKITWHTDAVLRKLNYLILLVIFFQNEHTSITSAIYYNILVRAKEKIGEIVWYFKWKRAKQRYIEYWESPFLLDLCVCMLCNCFFSLV